MPDPALMERLEVALAATREAGLGTLDWFQNPQLTVQTKADASPVPMGSAPAGEAEAADDGTSGDPGWLVPVAAVVGALVLVTALALVVRRRRAS